MNELLKMGLGEIADKIKSREVSSELVTNACFEQIENNKLNTYITLNRESALIKAKEVDKRIKAGESVGSLAGVPIGVKDNISTKGLLTTCGSKFLSSYVPPFDATVVERLKAADAVIIGKLNMDEFAMGSTNENSAYGSVKNAVDTSRVPGGSSGGSASTVAGFECFGALGSDTGGSIRQPASYCGVVGLKPTYSAVSRYGLIAFASSLDQIGTLTRSVEDAARLMEVISSYDKKDSTSSEKIDRNYSRFDSSIKGKRIGIAPEFFSNALDGGIKDSIMKGVSKFESLGALVTETHLTSFNAALSTYYVISSAEAASNLARFDGIKYGIRKGGSDYVDIYYNSRSEGFGAEVKRRIMVGNYVLSSGYYDAYYLKASKIRTIIKNEFDEAFKKCDVLICPTSPETAFKLGTKNEDKTKVYLSDIYTVPVNIAGLPAISIPCGKDKNGLPIGMQLIGKPFAERELLSFAAAFMNR